MKKSNHPTRNLLIFAGLNNNALITHLIPISRLKEKNEIFLVRNSQGPLIKNVKYVVPRLNFPIIRDISKFFLGFKFARKSTYIHSFYLIPHGIIALFVGKLTCKKVGVSLLGSDLDLHIKKRFYGNVFLKLLKKFDYVTVTGSNSLEYLRMKGINAVVLPHCVDTNRFKVNSRIKKEYDLLFVGRLSHEKRLDRIIEITEEVKKYKPYFRVMIVGSGPEEMKIKEMVKKLDLTETVKFAGWQANVIPYYQRSRIITIMSEREGSPLVLAEAMACGVVAVVLNVGDIGDIVNEKNGLIYDTFRPEMIAQDIIAVSKNKKLFKFLNKNSLKIRKSNSLFVGTTFWTTVLN